MHNIKLKSAVMVMGLAAGLATSACQSGFMSLDLNGNDDGEQAGMPGTPGGETEGPDTGEPPAGCTPDDRFFMREVWAPAVKTSCQGCHNPQGAAQDSDFILYNKGWGNYIELNMNSVAEFAKTKRDGESVLLLKPLGAVSHGGGAVISEGDDVYNRLKAFVDRAENPSACTAANDEDYYQGVQFLDTEQTMRKATLSLAGRLPTNEELNSGDLDATIEQVMSEDAFYDRLLEHFNDLLLTDMYLRGDDAVQLLDEDLFPNARYYEDIGDDDARNAERNRVNDAIAREPLKLIEYIVQNDRPFTEIIEADYTVVNPYSAQAYGIEDVTFNDDTDTEEWVEAQVPGQPHSGVLTSVTFLNRYPTTETNRNRHRSGIFYRYFLATDVLKLADRPIDPTQADLSQNPTLFDSQCTVCHDVVDPIAGAFQNWDEEGRYMPPESGWYTDMLPAGIENQNVPNDQWQESLPWLAEQAAADPRFVDSAIEHAFKMLTGQDPLTLPTDATRADYEAAFRAYEVQYEFFKQLGKTFVESNYNFKTLIKEIVKSPYYRAFNVAEPTPKRQSELADLGTSRILSPEMLHRKIQATTGTSWEVNGDPVLMDTDRFMLLYGGIDSVSITERMTEPNALAASIARRMSNDVSCLATARDFARPAGERFLFPAVETDVTDEAAVRENLVHLHFQLLGERVEDGDPELERSYNLFQDVYNDYSSGDYGDGLPGRCQADGVNGDPNRTIRSWMAVVSYMLSSYKFLHE
jgi:hypothetical protein